MTKESNSEMSARIDDLHARVERLEQDKREVVDKSVAVVTAPRQEDNRLRVVQLQTTTAGFVMPSMEELRKLFDIVISRYPHLRPQPYRDRFRHDADPDGFLSFCAFFFRIGHLKRTEQPNTKRAIGWWINEAEQFLSTAAGQKPEKGDAFVVAVIAHGDVGFIPYDGTVGQLWEFCLDPHSGRSATDEWRKVLAGELPTPMRSRYGAPAPVRTVQR